MDAASGAAPAALAAPQSEGSPAAPSRYESQKRRDWNTFLQYLRNHKPPLTLARCSGAHVIEFLKYLDQFGKTKAWGSLDALIGRLRAAFEENGGRPESNPFATRAVRIYLREIREGQAKARGIPYEKKKRKRTIVTTTVTAAATVMSTITGSSPNNTITNGAGSSTGNTTNGAGVSEPSAAATATPNVTTAAAV
ncbi:hypothetical protein JHK85_041371 [Glycine max]|nr:hypothetical protein JHK85_041371 [Glycine max]